ncbi:YitT family protein, partial [Escherichia coli]|nr:YitT family protein [Escherichia coli]
FIDFFNFILPALSTYTGSIIVFSLGVVLIGYGVGVYVSAGLGAGPRDSLMMLITEKTGWNVQWVRNGMELTILFAAWGMGGPIGF